MCHILAVETSTHACSASLLTYSQTDDSYQFFSRFELAPQRHTELLLPMLDEVIAESGLSLKDIDALAFGQGPGAFTGVRIAASVIKAIAFAHDLPIAEVSSLAAMAQAAYENNDLTPIVVMTDARMGEVYLAIYEQSDKNDKTLSLQNKEYLISPEKAIGLIKAATENTQQFIAVGNGWEVYQEQFSQFTESLESNLLITEDLPDAKQIAYLGLQKFLGGDLTDAVGALPVYLRNNIATPKKVQA